MIKFNNTPSEFAVILKKRVSEYFDSNKVKHTGNAQLYVKTIVLFTVAIGVFTVMLSTNLPMWVIPGMSIVFGLALASIGFNVMHDGAHGSYSKRGWVNKLMSYSLNLMGGSSYFWAQKHNIMHHSFTNIEGHDDDIDIRPWIRTNVHQSRSWYHRYQHIYWFVLYGLTYLSWVFTRDFEKYFTGRIAGRKIKNMSAQEHLIFWLTKIGYVMLFIVLPIYTMGAAKAIVFYTVAAFSCGWVISVIFQLAHITAEASFPLPSEESNKVEENWVVHQLSTTANFSVNSKIVSWFSGGLNFQIEHHLFPKISHVHYPRVSRLVKEVCEKYNVRYVEHPTLLGALRAHVRYLRTVGVAA